MTIRLVPVDQPETLYLYAGVSVQPGVIHGHSRKIFDFNKKLVIFNAT